MADAKTVVTVVTGNRRVDNRTVAGGTREVAAYVPVTVDIAREKDMTPAVILKGPVEKQIGGRTLSCYVTVDGKRLRFDESGNLVESRG